MPIVISHCNCLPGSIIRHYTNKCLACTDSSPSPGADAHCCCLPAVQFALQLEYLEAAFYSCATTGAPLPASVTGSTTVITEGCARGNYTEETYDVFGEIAADELNHVKVSHADAHINHDDGAIQALSRAPWPFPCCMPQPWLIPSACTLPLIAHRHLWCMQTFSTELLADQLHACRHAATC